MLVIKNVPKDAEGKWVYRDMWGGRIGVKIRPRTDESLEEIRKKFDDLPDGPEKNDKISDAVWDHVIEDFTPISVEQSDGSRVPVPNSLEGKKAVLKIQVPFGEQAMIPWIMDISAHFAYEFWESEIKN